MLERDRNRASGGSQGSGFLPQYTQKMSTIGGVQSVTDCSITKYFQAEARHSMVGAVGWGLSLGWESVMIPKASLCPDWVVLAVFSGYLVLAGDARGWRSGDERCALLRH